MREERTDDEPGGGTTDASSVEVGSGYTYETRIGNLDQSAFAIGENAVAEWLVVISMGAGIYTKAFLETLARHNADSLASAVRDHFRKTRRDRELVAGPENGAAARIVVTKDTPDEALLAVLDLDVTAEELRGKELWWNKAAAAWLPFEAFPAAADEATSTD